MVDVYAGTDPLTKKPRTQQALQLRPWGDPDSALKTGATRRGEISALRLQGATQADLLGRGNDEGSVGVAGVGSGPDGPGPARWAGLEVGTLPPGGSARPGGRVARSR